MTQEQAAFEVQRRVAVAKNSIDTALAVMRVLRDMGPAAGHGAALGAIEAGRMRELALWSEPWRPADDR